MANRDDDSPVTRDLKAVTKAADRLKLKGRDRARYIREHMTGFGYKTVETYVQPDDDDDDGDNRGIFGRRRTPRDDDDDDDD